MKARLFILVGLMLMAVLCTACADTKVVAAPAERTPLPVVNSKTPVVPTPSKILPTSTPLVPTATSTPAPTSTLMPTATVPTYAWLNTVQDAFYVGHHLGLAVTTFTGNYCFSGGPYEIRPGVCFEDLGQFSSEYLMNGPYFVTFLTVMSRSRVEMTSGRFMLLYDTHDWTHRVLRSETYFYLANLQPTRAKGEVYMAPLVVWSISKETYDLLSGAGMEEYSYFDWFELGLP